MFHFKFDTLKEQYVFALSKGYKILNCIEYYNYKNNNSKGVNNNVIVNRIDIECSVKKAKKLGEIYKELGITGTFFIRLHAPEYNLFSFENYKILKELINQGNEIGYHSEIIDQSVIWNEDPEYCLRRDIQIIENYFDIKLKGVASHGGMTGLNNLDFWKDRKAKDFGLAYEAYDSEPTFNLFNESLFVSDSEWFKWKCYNKGNLQIGDNRTFRQHLENNEHNLVYLLIHSDTYFYNHFYEDDK